MASLVDRASRGDGTNHARADHRGNAARAVPALAMDRSRFAVGPFDEIGRCELLDALGVAKAIGVVE